MSPSAHCIVTPVVQIVGPGDNWVLERLARRLAAKLPYAKFVTWRPERGKAGGLAYYVNYALYGESSGLLDVGFFTHRDDTFDFLGRAQRLDHCVCMARQYAEWLTANGVLRVTHIPMGCDFYRFEARLVVAVVGRLDHPRKGRALVDGIRQLPFVDVVTTEGNVPDERMRELYERADYVLIPALVEGGPMCLLEGLAVGKPIIAPEGVGMVPEFGPNEFILRYPAGDRDALIELVRKCYEAKRRGTALVQDRTWDRWAEDHHRLFNRLLAERGEPLPAPAPGFRFGLLREMSLPPGAVTAEVEAIVDRAASQLYFGHYREARAVLEPIATAFPSARNAIHAMPS
jgi:glycosyltransferase involved in cell wall biosynthesis